MAVGHRVSGSSLRVVRCYAVLGAGGVRELGRATWFRFRPSLQLMGSGSGKALKKADQRRVKKRDHAHLLWLGQGDPVRTIERLRKDDAATSNMIAIFSAWYDLFAEERVTVDEVIEKAEGHQFVEAPGPVLYPVREKQFTQPRLRNALMSVAKKNGQLDANRLRYWLRGVKERVVTVGEPGREFRVALVTEGTKHDSVAAWKIERRG